MNLSPLPVQKFFDNNGHPLVGGKLFTYVAGTSTKQPTYTTASGSQQNTNPIVMDFRGEARIWLDPELTYKFVLADRDDTDPPTRPIWSVDNIQGLLSGVGDLIPSQDNVYTLGNSSFAWKQIYLGADHSPALDVQTGNIGYYAITPAEEALLVVPVRYVYPEGDVRRYGGVTGGDISINTAALNAATRVCAYSKNTVVLPPSTPTSPYDINATWNCAAATSSVTGTNSGLAIRGSYIFGSFVRYYDGQNNVGIGWDQTGASYLDCKGFSFQGGISATNRPKAAVLQGPANNGGILRSLTSVFQDVEFVGYGDHVIYNAGSEQLDYFNCVGLSWSTDSTCQPYVFVASGSTPTVTSAIVSTYSPCPSMTQVQWHGARATNLFFGLGGGGPPVGVVFHFTGAAAGACADINFDGYFNVATASGTPFKFMVDDSVGSPNTGLFRCGGRDVILESGAANGDMSLAKFNVSVAKVNFTGHTASGTTITVPPIVFSSTCVPTDCHIEWDPNEAGGFSGGVVVNVQGHEAGVTVLSPVPAAQLISVAADRLIDGYHALGVWGSGTDYSLRGVGRVTGPTVNGQFNLVETAVAGNQTSAASRANKGIQTTQAVTTGATDICAFPGTAAVFYVTGISTTKKFMDVVTCITGGAPVVTGAASVGGADTRTYTTSGVSLRLAMSAGTYNIGVLAQGLGVQE